VFCDLQEYKLFYIYYLHPAILKIVTNEKGEAVGVLILL
jgi:3-methyladenine DNA glycosylase Mpg